MQMIKVEMRIDDARGILEIWITSYQGGKRCIVEPLRVDLRRIPEGEIALPAIKCTCEMGLDFLEAFAKAYEKLKGEFGGRFGEEEACVR